MDETHLYLAQIWFYLLGFILALYVMLDGFDLGVGLLSLLSPDEEHRGIMMSSLSAVWDANEVWLVIWGGALFGAFPLAYGLALNALYVPITLLLVGLILRGISFEFYSHGGHERLWSLAFGGGSLLAVLGQGLTLGGALSGISVSAEGRFDGGLFDWFNGLTGLVVIEVVAGYLMLGATYLIMKTRGSLQTRAYRCGLLSALASLGLALFTVLLLPHVNQALAARLLISPDKPGLLIVFGLSAVSFLLLLLCLWRRFERLPFVMSLLVFAVTFFGLWAGAYPDLLPGAVSIQAAASSPRTLIFMLVGIGMIIPIVIVYNGYIYLVFRGKISGQRKLYH
jgi:cytochrome d ubiquinol oxidase subunit II